MKKTAMIYSILLTGIVSLPAETSVELVTGEPHRMLEFGVDAGAYVANNLLRLSDIFNVRKTLTVDLVNVRVRELIAAAGGEADVFFNLNLRNGYGIGLFAGLDGAFYGTASESLMQLLGRGNVDTGSFNGNLNVGGSIFAEAGIKGMGRFNRLRLALKPAVFAPVIFIPASRADYSVDMTENGVSVHGLFDLNIYSVYALGEETGSSSDGNDTLPLGFDLSIGGEYALLPALDIGASISHLPVIPARMSHRMHIGSEYEFEIADTLDSITSGNVKLPDPELVTSYDNDISFYVFRPFRLNFYINYRPADTGLFVIRPSLGFSLLSVYDYAPCFNTGIEGQINILKIFSASLFAGYVERIWAYDFRFMLNLHVTEIIFGVSLRGTDLINAFGTRGLGLSLGLRFGY
ncbi:MAG: hypothetical protein LBF77_01430 [Spirochaetaceae bacterium]|jgi:hypothetical protein|nr:hypothetical protein [Spirochaetaceae bacterium]